jgi:long-chain acyl-CoA synthetase
MHPGIHAKSNPDKAAYIMAATGRAVTYRELDEESNRAANLFRSLGLRPGDGIALFAENHLRYHQVLWAAQRSGLYYTALSSRLTAEEVAYIVNDCGAKVFITTRAMADVAGQMDTAMIAGVIKRYMMDGAIANYESWEDAVGSQPSTPIADETEGAAMLYSSGTTGKPKGVKHRLSKQPLGGAPNPIGMLMSALYQATPEMLYLSPAPLYHSAPLQFTMAVHRIGGTVVVMEHFDVEQTLALIEKYRVTHTQMVPTMFIRMLKLPEPKRSKYDHSTLKVVIHAAAPCPIAIKEQMIAWWGPKIFEYYAGTEGNGFCAIDSSEWLLHKGSVGKALAGKVHIMGDDGAELSIGESGGEAGTIFFEGGAAFEYHNDPEKTKSSRNDKGWSTLGDIGYLDQDGYLYLTDRKANMIISGGVNIYPQEAENLLATHPKVEDVAVFGVPNEDFGEEVKAVVQPVDINQAGPDLAAELIDFCRAHLSAIKCPRTIDFDAELPRHPTGKLYKRLIKDRYWIGHSKRIAE